MLHVVSVVNNLIFQPYSLIIYQVGFLKWLTAVTMAHTAVHKDDCLLSGPCFVMSFHVMSFHFIVTPVLFTLLHFEPWGFALGWLLQRKIGNGRPGVDHFWYSEQQRVSNSWNLWIKNKKEEQIFFPWIFKVINNVSLGTKYGTLDSLSRRDILLCQNALWRGWVVFQIRGNRCFLQTVHSSFKDQLHWQTKQNKMKHRRFKHPNVQPHHIISNASPLA